MTYLLFLLLASQEPTRTRTAKPPPEPPTWLDRGENAWREQAKADPSFRERQPYWPASSLAKRDAEHSDDPYWEPAKRYADEADGYPLGRLYDDYASLLWSTEPVDLLTRREIAHQFEAIVRDDPDARPVARVMLQQAYDVEADPAIRLIHLNAIWDTVEVGDIEAADWLEARLATESDVRLVRPHLAVIARCIRTGEGPCYDD